MKCKIGIFGSAAGKITTDNIKKVRELGKVLGRNRVDVITGACSGIPHRVAFEAAGNGSLVYGFSPKLNLNEQRKFTSKDDLSIYKKITYIPKDFVFRDSFLVCKKYRNVISTANCDAGVIISGRYGTLNEFTNLYDMGKVIGVLTGTGGIADELSRLCRKLTKKSKAVVLFDSQPEKLIKNVIKELKKRI